MIEEDIRELYNKIEDLECKVDKVIQYLPDNAFVFTVHNLWYELDYEFKTYEDALSFIEDQKTKDKDRFRKNSDLADCEIGKVKITKKLNNELRRL